MTQVKFSYSVFLLIILSIGCAHSKVTLVGLSDANKSFVRTIDAEGKNCGMAQYTDDNKITTSIVMSPVTFDQALICETTLPVITKQVKVDQNSYTIPRQLQKVAIMGDTGCRIKNTAKNGGPIQKCDDDKEWPFRTVVRSVTAENADLIIHVGDYHYREFCADPVLCAPYVSTVTYGYKGWNADFYEPAAELLKQKPFIFVRGNHEDCQRAHEGFDKSLSPLGQLTCDVDQPTRYTVFDDILIVNFDMASVDDKPLDINSDSFKRLRVRYLAMLNQIAQSPQQKVWFISHKPIWALAPIGGSIVPTNLNLQKVVQENPLPAKVKFAFAGHIHNYQLSLNAQPIQLVVGESGSALDPVNPAPDQIYQLPNGVKVFSPTTTSGDFGYVMLEKQNSGEWLAKIKNTVGQTQYTCDLSGVSQPCQKN